MRGTLPTWDDSESQVPSGPQRSRCHQEDGAVASRNVFNRSECPGTAIDVDTEGLHSVLGGPAALQFVRIFYGQPSRYLWGGTKKGLCTPLIKEKGMSKGTPLLFSLGQQHPSGGRKDVRSFGRHQQLNHYGQRKMLGSSTPTSVCTVGRPKCGTKAARVDSMPWKE